MTQSWRPVLNFKFSVSLFPSSDVNYLLDEHKVKNVQREIFSMQIYFACDNKCWSKVWGQEYWCILSFKKEKVQLAQQYESAHVSLFGSVDSGSW